MLTENDFKVYECKGKVSPKKKKSLAATAAPSNPIPCPQHHGAAVLSCSGTALWGGCQHRKLVYLFSKTSVP